jgi:hypothetical protein
MSRADEYLPGPPEPERLPLRRIATVGLAALAVFAAGCIGVFWYSSSRRAALGGQPQGAPRIGQPEVGLVEQRPFALEQTAAEKRALQRHQLEAYGWKDRGRGRIHIPIERAMELVAGSGSRP